MIAAYLTFLLITLSTWYNLCGLWLELPEFLRHVTEGYNIANLMNLTAQVGNLAVVVAFLVPTRLHPSPTNLLRALQLLSLTTALLLAFFWDSRVGGHSVPLVILAGLAGAIGCVMNIAIWPFASQYSPLMRNAISTGSGVSSVVPGLLALAQNVGSETNMHFSTRTFFLAGAAFQAGSIIALYFATSSSLLESHRRHPKATEDAVATTPIVAPLLSVTEYNRTVRVRGAVLFIAGILQFGLAPGAVPYFIHGGQGLLLFTFFGQFANVAGSFLALVIHVPRPILYVVAQYCCMVFMLFFSLYVSESWRGFTATMTIATSAFNFLFGLNIAQVFMHAPERPAVPARFKSQRPINGENRRPRLPSENLGEREALLQPASTAATNHVYPIAAGESKELENCGKEPELLEHSTRHADQEHYSRVLGGCMTLGSGAGAIGLFLYLHYGH